MKSLQAILKEGMLMEKGEKEVTDNKSEVYMKFIVPNNLNISLLKLRAAPG